MESNDQTGKSGKSGKGRASKLVGIGGVGSVVALGLAKLGGIGSLPHIPQKAIAVANEIPWPILAIGGLLFLLLFNLKSTRVWGLGFIEPLVCLGIRIKTARTVAKNDEARARAEGTRIATEGIRAENERLNAEVEQTKLKQTLKEAAAQISTQAGGGQGLKAMPATPGMQSRSRLLPQLSQSRSVSSEGETTAQWTEEAICQKWLASDQEEARRLAPHYAESMVAGQLMLRMTIKEMCDRGRSFGRDIPEVVMRFFIRHPELFPRPDLLDILCEILFAAPSFFQRGGRQYDVNGETVWAQRRLIHYHERDIAKVHLLLLKQLETEENLPDPAVIETTLRRIEDRLLRKNDDRKRPARMKGKHK